MATTKQLDTSLVEKKFASARATPDSIQSVALWILTHKSQCDQIVATWLSVLKASKIEKRLTLFYICNEIVQTCRKKHAVIYKDAFKEVLRDAAILARDKSISENVKRIFKIWQERGTYDKEFVEELLNLLIGDKVQPSSSKLLSEFSPAGLRESLKEFHDEEVKLNEKRKILTSVNVDLHNKQLAKLFKDRSHGKQYGQQIKDSYSSLTEFVGKIEKSVVDRVSLIDKLEYGLLFYDMQYGEAKIVTNAYRNFGNRIKNLQKKLEEQIKILPSPSSPVPSPPSDAPSPVDSFNGDCNKDNMETVDMDLSDEEAFGGNSTQDVPLQPSFETSSRASFDRYDHGNNSMFGSPSNYQRQRLQSGDPDCLNMSQSPHMDQSSSFQGFAHQQFSNYEFFNRNHSPIITSNQPQYKKEALTSQLHNPAGSYFFNPQEPSSRNTEAYAQTPGGGSQSDLNGPSSSSIPSEQFMNNSSWEAPGNTSHSQRRFLLKTPEKEDLTYDPMKATNNLTTENGTAAQLNKNASNSEERLDPFSLLDKILAQGRQGEASSNGNNASLFDMLAKNKKQSSMPVANEPPLSTSPLTPVLYDAQNPVLGNEGGHFNGNLKMPQVEAVNADKTKSLESSSNNMSNSGVSPKIEKNILSTVSDLKPDVFEVLKSILSSTKKPVTSECSPNIPASNPSVFHTSVSPPALQENDSTDYNMDDTDLCRPDKDPSYLDYQPDYYEEDQYDNPSFVCQNENDDMQEGRNFSQSNAVPPLVAPKCFLEIYSHGNFRDDEMENMEGPMSEIPEDPARLRHDGPPEQEFECYDNYYPEDEPIPPNFDPEYCDDFREHHNNHGPPQDNYLPPRRHFNYRPDFRHQFNRNVRFQPPRQMGFREFPRQRFNKPRYFGRGHFPR